MGLASGAPLLATLQFELLCTVRLAAKGGRGGGGGGANSEQGERGAAGRRTAHDGATAHYFY